MTGSASQRFDEAKAVADAVLYEGYVLYPYRASAAKNRTRWQFGVLVPPAFAEADGHERSGVHNEVLLDSRGEPSVELRVRFLQLQHRQVEVLSAGGFSAVERLEVAGRPISSWDEAVERVVDLSLEARPGLVVEKEVAFRFDAGKDLEELVGATGAVEGRVVRTRQEVAGLARLAAGPAAPGLPSLLKVEVAVQNTSGWRPSGTGRKEALAHSLLGLHTIAATDGGRFLSLLEPPAQAVGAARSLRNEGAFPVLVGRDDKVVLCSPIILYDHPQVAPESPGDLYDATEIDEILALRVLTLTDEEKLEARGTDPRAAAVIDRCDGLAPDAWERLHGAIRDMHPLEGTPAAPGADGEPWWDPTFDTTVAPEADSVRVGAVEVCKGSKVRLAPSRRADAQDLFLAGRTATVAGVFEDLDGGRHVAVTLDDDPAAEELLWQGRYLYFHPEEVQPLAEEEEQW